MKCEPATSIVSLLGGISAAAAICGVSQTQVQRWRFSQEKGGTGGFIPRKYHERIIEAAAGKGHALTASSFMDISAVPTSAEAAA